jgi:hypothetical protein
MDLLKNTSLLNWSYVVFAILVVLLGVWREQVFREKSDKQQDELNVKQTKVNEQQQEIIRLIYKIDELQSKRSDAISKDIGQVKNLIEAMRRQAIISDSTAKDMIEILESKATSQSTVSDRAIEISPPQGSIKGQ